MSTLQKMAVGCLVVSVLAAGFAFAWAYLSAPVVQIDQNGKKLAVCTRDGLVHPPSYLKTYHGWYDTENVDWTYKPVFTAP